jgi:ABC-type hemin transport system substrate-binding protein
MRAGARRIVSLVPSLSEALFSLGLGERLVGVTDWCVHPAAGVAPLPKVGGTKNPSLERIRELTPDLVIANREENRERDVEKLRAEGFDVWVTYPRTVADGLALMREVAALGADPAVAAACIEPDTYANDMIAVCGGANVFAFRKDRRYPIVSKEEIVEAAPGVVLLPDEPYAFVERDVEELAELPIPAAQSARIHRIDGTLISWYGPRIGRALSEIPSLLVP